MLHNFYSFHFITDKNNKNYFPLDAADQYGKAQNPANPKMISVNSDQEMLKKTFNKIQVFQDYADKAYDALNVQALESALGSFNGCHLAQPDLQANEFEMPSDACK